jgi:hypothetical protein
MPSTSAVREPRKSDNPSKPKGGHEDHREGGPAQVRQVREGHRPRSQRKTVRFEQAYRDGKWIAVEVFHPDCAT